MALTGLWEVEFGCCLMQGHETRRPHTEVLFTPLFHSVCVCVVRGRPRGHKHRHTHCPVWPILLSSGEVRYGTNFNNAPSVNSNFCPLHHAQHST